MFLIPGDLLGNQIGRYLTASIGRPVLELKSSQELASYPVYSKFASKSVHNAQMMLDGVDTR